MKPKTTTIDGEQVTYTGELTNIKIIRRTRYNASVERAWQQLIGIIRQMRQQEEATKANMGGI